MAWWQSLASAAHSVPCVSKKTLWLATLLTLSNFLIFFPESSTIYIIPKHYWYKQKYIISNKYVQANIVSEITIFFSKSQYIFISCISTKITGSYVHVVPFTLHTAIYHYQQHILPDVSRFPWSISNFRTFLWVQFPVPNIYIGMLPATQANSAWPSLRG